MKGTCKSLTKLEYFCEEVYKATTEKLDWINPEGRQYPHDLRKPLPLVPNSQGRHVIPFHHFINNDLEYLRGVSQHNISTHYDKFALWGITLLRSKKQDNTDAFGGPKGNLARERLLKKENYCCTKVEIVEWQNYKKKYKHLDWITVTFNTTAGNPVKKILLKLNLSDHRLFKDGGGVKEIQERCNTKAFQVNKSRKMLKITISNTSSRNKLNPEINDHYNIFIGECQKDELKTKDKAFCPNNSCISEGTKRYGDFAIGVAPGTRSMRNSTYRCGGNPDKSSRNTSSNSRTTDILLNLGSSSFALFNALVIPTTHSPCTLRTLPSSTGISTTFS
ncbi:hypothetical protein Tco_0139993 [Tanacetum coccineum]